MKKHEVIIILSILTMHYNFATTQRVEQNEPIDLRIRHLKHELLQDLHPQYEKESYSDSGEIGLDYVDNSNKPITPISEHDERKLDERYKQPELQSTTTEKYIASPENITETQRPLKTQHKSNKRSRQRMVRKPKPETYYRKMAFDVSKDRNKPQKWTHCLDLLSPYLNGYLFNISHINKKIYSTDNTIRRLSYLLTLNMSDATTEEIRATLYEISNTPMRIYQWDISAVKSIIRAIVRDGPHDFKGLKYGFKGLFNMWQLNTSNLTRLLTQSRVFRPPCIQIHEETGSTIPRKQKRFTKPDQNGNNDNKNTYPPRNEDC